jgi:hypothetical protein
MCVNKDTGVSEKGRPVSDRSGESSCVKHNLTSPNKNIHGTSVNTEIKVGENSFCKSESNFTHDGNIVVGINLRFHCSWYQPAFSFIQKKTVADIVVVISLFWKSMKVERYCKQFSY